MEEKTEIKELIYNQDFIDWVINPDDNDDVYWTDFIGQHSNYKHEIEKAIFVIKSLQINEKSLDAREIENIWISIVNGKSEQKRKLIPLWKWIAAASVLLVIGIGSTIFYSTSIHRGSLVNYKSMVQAKPIGNDIKLILSNKTEKLLSDNDPEIKYNKQGQIEINSSGANKKVVNKQDAKEVQMNQLIVPFGKRSNLVLSDGSKLWINSGSRVVYPPVFNKSKREIYVRGEVYLEVTHNAEKPFYVVTDHLKVRVFGTKFNVNSYSNESQTSVVLVEGSVQAITDAQKIMIKPNQLFTLKNSSGKTEIKDTNVLEYISWKDGWMYCNNEKLEDIGIKLSRYYNVKIQFSDPEIKDMTISGKLDLKSSCKKVFDVISFIAPVDYRIDDNGDIIVLKKITDKNKPM